MNRTVFIFTLLLLLSVPAFAGAPVPVKLSYLKLDQLKGTPVFNGGSSAGNEKQDEKLLLVTGDFVRSLPIRIGYLKLDQLNAVAIPSEKPDIGRKLPDEKLNLLTAEFTRFAHSRVELMNRNLAVSRERMQIRREMDGSYRAVFHQIDDGSLACEVSRSQSRSIPYVAVLSYREQVYAASCTTPAECRQGPFAMVGFIPNRHIFSYSNGTWN